MKTNTKTTTISSKPERPPITASTARPLLSQLSRAAMALALPVTFAPSALAQRDGTVDGDDFTTWIRSYPGISSFERGLLDDPDKDQISNLGERIFGTHPGIPNPDLPPATRIDRRSNGEVFYRVDPEIQRLPEYSHSLEMSTDLQQWDTVPTQSDESGLFWFEGLRPGAASFDPTYFRVRYKYTPPAHTNPLPTFSARGEENLGIFDPNSNTPWSLSDAEEDSWRSHSKPNWVDLRAGYSPKMASNFLIEGYNVPVSITLSAEAFVKEAGRRMFVRLLVDGQPMKPADVVFIRGKEGGMRATRNFEFTGLFDPGLHTVEAQWMVDEGATGYIRDAALFIRQGDRDDARGTLISKTPDSGSNLETDSAAWQDVPGLQRSITTSPGDCLTATFSAEAWASGGDSVQIRVLVDGSEAEPGPVEFAHGSFEGTRTMVFGLGELPAGSHNVKVQWRADQGGTAGMGDRTLTLAAQGSDATSAKVFRSSQSEVEVSGNWANVPGLSAGGNLPVDSDVSVVFSAEFLEAPEGTIEARLTVDGNPVDGSRVMLSNGGSGAGVHAYTFDAKHLFAGQAAGQVGQVAVQWRVNSGQAPKVGARSASIYVKRHAVPDLAEAPPFGMVNGIEPVHGEVNVLAVIFDWDRPNHPTPSKAQVEDALFGATDSAADYFEKVSGGRLSLKKAGVIGPVDADFSHNYYDSISGGHQQTWIEALEKADPSFDFGKYDRNGDGYLNSWDELVVMIIKPQNGTAGFVRQLWKNKNPQTTDEGVYVDFITEWYTSDPQKDYAVGIHEMCHSILGLGDHYHKSNGTKRITQPGQYDIMDMGGSSNAPHPDPMTKLALGWVTPRILTKSQAVSLEDVKVSREVVVLPRTPGSAGDEYIVLENRPEAADNSRYDFGLFDEGIAVWHIVENRDHWPLAPVCESPAVWSGETSNGADGPRAGIRLIRPKQVYSNVNALWTNAEYDLDPFGLICWTDNDSPYHNVLRWVDGTNSYSITNFSAPGPVMNFHVAP